MAKWLKGPDLTPRWQLHRIIHQLQPKGSLMSIEQRLREDLATLAASDDGRRLLQLGLRSIARGEREVTAGCWIKRGDAGCLFQHAYWEGVREGIFADKG